MPLPSLFLGARPLAGPAPLHHDIVQLLAVKDDGEEVDLALRPGLGLLQSGHSSWGEGVHRNDLLLVLFGSEVRTHRGSCRYFRRFWKALPPHLGMQKNGEAGDH